MADVLFTLVVTLVTGAIAGWSASEWRQEYEEDIRQREREVQRRRVLAPMYRARAEVFDAIMARRPTRGAPMPQRPKHLLLSIELPSVYTADIDLESDLRKDFGASDSEFILNCIGEPGVARVRMEISGEKDSDVVEVWGSVREAALVEPSRGYVSAAPHITEDQLAEHGWKLMREDNDCEWCKTNA
jgi:hypothetical protein